MAMVADAVEAGYTLPIIQSSTFFLRPQAQVTWMGVKCNDHREDNGAQVKGTGNSNVQSRIGARLYIDSKSLNSTSQFKPFIEENWIHNTEDYGVKMDNVSTHINGSQNIAELKAGVEGRMSNNFSCWGSVGQQQGGEVYRNTNGGLGVNYKF